ncbi:MarR family winged helix-turn-helix transcriptional regulator [Streptococcus sp. DD12]|uniref:MarR family winged helix-turn-helix transcriptional regulator n=1 Tax=Streptococcus sp. DD12 TaxID=1777880 RepID=UPI000799AC3F|nr:MarR family winged helix-turn-helix transcriptional regulator [Streptococcus sp. DD12]KXT75591.1 Transcriptional regulator, MarR family [Streptococcus sp. DD12]
MQGPFERFRLFVNLLESRARSLAKDYAVENLAGPQGVSLLYLINHQKEESYIRDIERRLKVSKSVASGLIKRMEKNGYVTIVPSQKDKRYKQVLLTDLGKTEGQRFSIFVDAIHDQLFEGISKSDIRTALHVLDRLQKNLEKGDQDV